MLFRESGRSLEDQAAGRILRDARKGRLLRMRSQTFMGRSMSRRQVYVACGNLATMRVSNLEVTAGAAVRACEETQPTIALARRLRYHRLTEENSVLQFLPHSGAEASTNQTSTNAQNAITATQPDRTVLISSLSACLSHLRICPSRQESRR
jgi:hypothetical protein